MKYVLLATFSSLMTFFLFSTKEDERKKLQSNLPLTENLKCPKQQPIEKESFKKPILQELELFLCELPPPPAFTNRLQLSQDIEETKKESEADLFFKKHMIPIDRKKYRYYNDIKIDENSLKNYFPRFSASNFLPKDWHYYGIHLGDYKDIRHFLGVRECKQPHFYKLENKNRDKVFFLNSNINKKYEGRARIIGAENASAIKSKLYFETFPPTTNLVNYYTYENFSLSEYLWREGPFKYGSQTLNEREESPWFFNGCTKGMSMALNECWLDQNYDIALVDFFQLTEPDLIFANFYCKKSNQKDWFRIAYIEMIRIF